MNGSSLRSKRRPRLAIERKRGLRRFYVAKGNMKLLDEIGFDGLDAGTLEESWRQQPGTPAYCTDFDATALPGALASADRLKSAQLREELVKRKKSLPPDAPDRELVRLDRTMWPSLPQS
jgi:hypothetical protein